MAVERWVQLLLVVLILLSGSAAWAGDGSGVHTDGHDDDRGLEACLRELDADLVGLGGFNLGGTMDAAVGAERPWWGRWSGHGAIQPAEPCPPLASAIESTFYPRADSDEAAAFTAFNKCEYGLNRDRFPVGEGERKEPPLVLIIDPRTAKASMRTLEALRYVEVVGPPRRMSCSWPDSGACGHACGRVQVDDPGALAQWQGIERTVLQVFLDGCGPADAKWPPHVATECEHGISRHHANLLLKVDFMQVKIRGLVLSDSMLVTLPVKETRWATRLWRREQAASPEYLKIRAMHAMRDVLTDGVPAANMFGTPRLAESRGQLSLVLLEAGCIPLPSFLVFHTAAVSLLHRSAVVAVSSLAPPKRHTVHPGRMPTAFEHPCLPDDFRLSDALRLSPSLSVGSSPPGMAQLAGAGGSIGLNRRGLLELYTTLQVHQTMGLREALQWLQVQHASARFFLHPAQAACVEVESLVDALDEARQLGEQGTDTWQDWATPESCSRNGDALKRLLLLSEARVRESGYGAGVRMEQCARHGWSPRFLPRKVYDVVTYLQERQMQVLRMQELKDAVDVHVLVEGDRSFRSVPKPYNVHRHSHSFKAFAHKMRVVEVTLPAHKDISCPVFSPDYSCTQDAGESGGPYEAALHGSWTSGYRDWFKREWYSRHTMAWGLWDAGPDDVILMGDVDEIPRAALVSLLKWCDGIPLALGMTSRWFQYNASFQKPDWFLTPNAILFRALGHGEAGFARPDGASGGEGVGPVVTAHTGTGGADLAYGGYVSSKALRCYGFWHLIPWLDDVAWHLSYFGDTISFLNKISSFSDEVDLDVVNAAQIDQLVAQGADLHSFLETLRDATRSPGQAVRQLVRTSDYSVLPSFLSSHPEVFSFQFTADASLIPVSPAGRLPDAASSQLQAGWHECRRVSGGALARDHTSLHVSSCKASKGDDETGGMASDQFTRVQVKGACDLPPRPWPPAAPCTLGNRSGALSWTPPFEDIHEHAATWDMPDMSQRPVVLIWKVLPLGAPRLKQATSGEFREGQLRGSDAVEETQRQRAAWKQAVEAYHEDMVAGCETRCVSLQGGDGWEGDWCAREGYGDLILYGHDWSTQQVKMPLATAFKHQREMWGYSTNIEPSQSAADAQQSAGADLQLFDVVLSPSTFPDAFVSVGSSDADGLSSQSLLNVCGLCRQVARMVHDRCASEPLVPGRRETDPHVLILLPQNGHGYSGHNLRIVYRVSGVGFLENGTDATVDIVGRQETVVHIGQNMADTRKVLSYNPRVEEFRFLIPYLESGFWEVHVTLRNARRRPLASDHILFKTHG